MTEQQLRDSLEKRWHERVRVGRPNECWEWRGHKTKAGYGCLGTGKRGMVYAHRLALELADQPAPRPDSHACHRCDNPGCCNPAHLFWGTNFDNAQDARFKGLRVKETCRRGHPKTPENTYERVDRRGYLERHCRECGRQRWRARNSKGKVESLTVS